MISRHEIRAVSITQDNGASCHEHKYALLAQNVHRHANKKRRQSLRKKLREECNELGIVSYR